MNGWMLYKEIEELCKELESKFDLVPEKRKEKLAQLSDYIVNKIREEQVPKIVDDLHT